MMQRFPAYAAAAALLLAIVSLSPTARAAELTTQETKVSLRGVKLDSEAGQAAMQAKLKRAAQIVCGTEDSRNLSGMADMTACQKSAMLQAVTQLEIAIAAATPVMVSLK